MKRGLVLCGGGAKGAYQIGVWRALRELGLDRFDAISGASVGALNAVLWAAGDYENAYRVWSSLRFSDFITPSTDGQRIASREGLRHIIREHADLAAVRESKIPIYVNILNARTMQVEYRRLNGLSDTEIEDLLIASSSIPAVYGKAEVDGKQYWDGGWFIGGDNAPVAPLYQSEGIRDMVIIELTGSERVELPPDCRALRIIPDYSLGNLLHFGQSAIAQRMEQGYRDAMAVLAGSEPELPEVEALLDAVHTVPELEQFIRCGSYPNAPLSVMDGGVFWDDICTIGSYRLQRNKQFLNLRILDGNGVRRAWWLRSSDFFAAIEKYKQLYSVKEV